VHIGCTREEQLRWLREAWDSAHEVRKEGADVRAITVWAVFGSCDWDSLLTMRTGRYEPGLWDVRGPAPRLTALGAYARHLGQGEASEPPQPAHAALKSGDGWWRRDVRLLYPDNLPAALRPLDGRPLLITGATGTLGSAFARVCEQRGLPHKLLRRDEMDIGDPSSVEEALKRWQPWALINTAGYVRVDDAERDGQRQWRENALGPAVLARACRQAGLPLLTFSSDLVFDGGQETPYRESDSPRPLNAYGRAKHAAEREVLALHPTSLVVRAAAFFSPWDRHNFIVQGLKRLQQGEAWLATDEQVVSPTYVPDLVHACLDLLVDGETGLWHLASDGAVSWAEFARRAAEAAGLDVRHVQAVPAQALGLVAPRPRFSALGSERARLMPRLDDAMLRFVEAAQAAGLP
jgi:dTDP-4-dehydrorhamnose reductase